MSICEYRISLKQVCKTCKKVISFQEQENWNYFNYSKIKYQRILLGVEETHIFFLFQKDCYGLLYVNKNKLSNGISKK